MNLVSSVTSRELRHIRRLQHDQATDGSTPPLVPLARPELGATSAAANPSAHPSGGERSRARHTSRRVASAVCAAQQPRAVPSALLLSGYKGGASGSV